MGRVGIVTCLIGILCIFAGDGAFAAVANDSISEARAKLRQAVEKAHDGSMGELSNIAQSFRRKDSPYLRSELQPDYIALLKDPSGNVHLYAVQLLIQFKNTATRDALCEYLKTRDLAKLKAYVRDGRDTTPEAIQSALEPMAVSYAILALGEIGDRSVIPLLSDLRDDITWEAEWVGRPVEHALGQLGAVRILASTPPNAEERQLGAAAGAISSIKDPNRVPELMAVAQDTGCQERFRFAALSALGRFNSPDVSRLLISIMNDPNAPMNLRKEAATSAAQTGDKTVETALLAHANDPKSPFRVHAIVGLAIENPEKHLARWFSTVLDVNEDLAFRKTLFSYGQRISHLVLRNRKEDLYRCLQATEKNGRPIDDIRAAVWYMICDYFGEQPALVLTTKDRSITASMRSIIERRLIQNNQKGSPWELRALADKKIEELVTVYRPTVR